jgi:hypothetical protein
MPEAKHPPLVLYCCRVASPRAVVLYCCRLASPCSLCLYCRRLASPCALRCGCCRHFPRVQPQRHVEVSKPSTPSANREVTAATPRLRIREQEGRTKRAGPASQNQEIKRIGSFWDDIWHSASEDSHKQGNSTKDAPSTCGERGRLHFVGYTPP